MAFIRAILLAYRRAGIDPGEALAAAQIATHETLVENARVTALQMELMSGSAMQQLDDEALGWFSRRLPWGSYGMLCRASITSPDLGVALKRWCRHHRLLTADVLFELTVADGAATLALAEHQIAPGMREFCLLTLLRYVLGYACWAIDSRIPLAAVRFPFAPPPHADAYALMFRCPVEFDAPAAALVFDAAYLGLPLARDERALRRMLQRALPLTVLQYRRDRLLVQRVRQALDRALERDHTADAIAAALHLSSRSLHRQLQEEGASFQQIKDEARRDRAVDLLNRSELSVKRIAQACGFRSEKSFARAFRGWTGEAPSDFRRRTVVVHAPADHAPVVK